MVFAAVVVVVDVLLRVMAHDPIRSCLAEYVWVSGNLIPVCVVKLLSVVEDPFFFFFFERRIHARTCDAWLAHFILFHGHVCVLTVGGYELSQLMRYPTFHPAASTLPKNAHPPWPLLPRSPRSVRESVRRRQVGQLGHQEKSTSVGNCARAISSRRSGFSELL